MSWDPVQYLKFSNQRLRPALDLLARLPLRTPETVVDLGCGAGNVVRVLSERWPDAHVTGVDSSAEMLEKAQAVLPSVEWQLSEIASWQPSAPVDLIFSNAALHWLPHHDKLLARLVGFLKPGGLLAVQMPHNFAAPSHTSIDDALAGLPMSAAWRTRIMAAKLNHPVADPAQYYAWLKPKVAEVDIWETIYLHVLEGENAVAEWFKATALIPVMDVLSELEEENEAQTGHVGGLRERFWADYCARTNTAYPRRHDGTTLFPMRRLFIVARVAGATGKPGQ
ncbi:methyltransferase domain-containing protein [Propionivibrio soli]|uniref:methyltransferase domain-containing protein n=1 Tax=Propionivibrio soli TaxID=2976531 RepID=UPI0021E87193|nr:methyltransferase domain-containing protein [Propionivibrio soli]